MKIRILTAAALVALFATSTASASWGSGGHHGSDLTITNNSGGSIAVGDTVVGAGVIVPGLGAGGFLAGAGGRAYAGSVVVKGCDCDRKTTTITNNSGGSIAVGAGSAGSVFVSSM